MKIESQAKIFLLKGRFIKSTVVASSATRWKARTLERLRAPVVNTLSIDDLALLATRVLALVKRKVRAVHAICGHRYEHQPHVRIDFNSLQLVVCKLLSECPELVSFLTRIADELRTALRRSPTLGHQVVREILIQSNLTSRCTCKG